MRRVLIVEDIAETRQWLATIVRAAFPKAEVGFAAALRAGRAKAAVVSDLALIEPGLPDGSGLDLLRVLKGAEAQTLCVVTTVPAGDATVPADAATVVAALSAGADGHLLTESPVEVLTRQLSQISQGAPAQSPAIARRIMDHFRLAGPRRG